MAYDYQPFPHPRRVRMFLAEKGITIPVEQVDVMAGEHRSPEYLGKNPEGLVPLLELDNGEYVTETVAISRYFEETQPQPALMGSGPEDKARTEMWHRRVESGLFNALITYFHHATEGLGDERYRNKEWGEQNKTIALNTMKKLNERLAESKFIAGDVFTIADITAVCGIDLGNMLENTIPDELVNLKRWYDEVSQRPSAKA